MAAAGEAAHPRELVVSTFNDVICTGTSCNVELRASEISFVTMDGQPFDGLPLVLPLKLVQGLNVATSATAATCLLTISTDDKPLELSFRAKSLLTAIQKEHVKARDKFVTELEHVLAAAKEVYCPAPDPPTSSTPPTTKQPMETARMRKGRELRELLQRVSKLNTTHKRKEAEELLESAAADSGGSAALARKRSQQLRKELFTFGGLELTKSALMHFLHLPEVKLLLPESAKKAQQEVTDSKTARILLEVSIPPPPPLGFKVLSAIVRYRLPPALLLGRRARSRANVLIGPIQRRRPPSSYMRY